MLHRPQTPGAGSRRPGLSSISSPPSAPQKSPADVVASHKTRAKRTGRPQGDGPPLRQIIQH
ncbi:hypothetical protein AZA_61235 [Nitrospirillum viridazoti Y2]|nr:hypothetical protein AZA_61235 [Nitrospirillum amazonense Y2]